MFTRLRALIRNYLAMLLLLGVAAGAGTGPSAPDVELEVAIAVDAPATLLFSVTNDDPEPVLKGELGVNTNKIVTLHANGAVTAGMTIAEIRDAPREMIDPGETVEWRWNIPAAQLQPGTSRLYWDFGGKRSREIALFRPHHDGEVPHRAGTPTEVLKQFYRALDGEVTALGPSLFVNDAVAAEVAVQRVLFRRAMACRRLRERATRRFGAAAVEGWALEATASTFNAIDDAEVRYPPYFDSCEVFIGRVPLKLVREEEHWRVAGTNFTQDGRPHPEIDRRTTVIEAVSMEIENGEYNSFRAAARALWQRLELPRGDK